MKNKLLCFGLGYTAKLLSQYVMQNGWSVIGTKKQAAECDFPLYVFHEQQLIEKFVSVARDVTHILISIPPFSDDIMDIVLHYHKKALQKLPHLQWVGYLSSTAIYGDHEGNWVDEDTPPIPTHIRSKRRLAAESAWLETGLPVHIFRLSGIYGPNRNIFPRLLKNEVQNIVKKGQFFSRIHVDDIIGVLWSSMAKRNPGEIYNIADDMPAPPQDILEYACQLMNINIPSPVSYDQAHLSPMAQSFYVDNKRVGNNKIKNALGYSLKFSDFKIGLKKVYDDMTNITNI